MELRFGLQKNWIRTHKFLLQKYKINSYYLIIPRVFDQHLSVKYLVAKIIKLLL